MFNRVVITSGVSLIFNNRDLIEAKFSMDQLTEDSFIESGELIDYLASELLNLEESVLDRKSAEISMIAVLQQSERLINNPYITLFYTDTFKGHIAGAVNKIILENVYGATVRMRKIFELDVNNRSVLNRALGKYLSDVSESLKEGEPRTTCFAPIGGYKVMTSLGYLAGALHNFPTAYLHEGSTVIHEIPAVTVEIDEGFITENYTLLKKFFDGDCFEYDGLSREEQLLIQKQTVMFEQVEGLVELNPFGRFLCDQNKYHKYFKSEVYITETLKHNIDNRYANYWPDVYEEIKSLIFEYESKSPNYRSTLYHESDFTQLNGKNLTYHLFKGGNSPVFRAIWQYNEEADSYYIAHIWFDHNAYVREVVQTIQQSQANNQWVNITGELYA